MKYFISLISALLFTFTVFAQGVLEIKQSRQTFKKPSWRRSADDSGLYGSNTDTQPSSLPASLP